MAHWYAPPTSRSPATRTRSPTPGGESFAGSLSGGMATPTPAPDLLVTPPPLGVRSGPPLIRCPECGGGLVEEYVPRLGGATTAGNLCERCGEEAGVPDSGGGSFFKTPEEYKAILRDRGLLGPAGAGATPEPGPHWSPLVLGSSGFLVPAPVGNPKMDAAVEDLKHEMAALNLAIAQLRTDISMGKLGAEDKVQKVAKTDSILRWGKAIVKWFFMTNAVVLLLGIVVAMSVK